MPNIINYVKKVIAVFTFISAIASFFGIFIPKDSQGFMSFATTIDHWLINNAVYPGIFIVSTILFLGILILPGVWRVLFLWIKKQLRIFYVEYVVPAHTFANGKELYNVTANLRFLHTVKNATIHLDISGTIRDTIELARNVEFIKNQTAKIIIAQIPHNWHENGTWGENGNKVICPLSKSRVFIDIQTRHWFFRRQRFKLYIEMMRDGTATSGRFFLASELNDPLDD